MDQAELKRLLRLAHDEPVQAAIALSADGKAVVQLDRRKPGRMLEKQLKEDTPDSRNRCWGTASIDPSYAKLVTFTLNKAPGGIARRLVVALKGTGFRKVQLQLEDGTELESHEEADETALPEQSMHETAVGAAPEGPVADSKAPTGQNMGSLTQELTLLVR